MGTIDFTDNIYDAQQGSQSAIKFIYDNTIQLFYKETMVFLRDRVDADCAIRDAFIFIFDHLNTLEDTSKFLLWANEVCKNTCIARLKQYDTFSNRVPAEAANLGEILPSSDYDSLINSNASMTAEHIQICLDAILNSLPDDQRVCAILWGEGYPLRSIARKLGISIMAVNYTLACTLGNITNAVTTLGENGLPLYSMEPIPFFLWLLISYYQDYQPTELTPGAESSFSNILRILMPEEASIFMSDFIYSENEVENTDGKVKHITGIETNQFESGVAPGYDDAQYSDDNAAPAADGSDAVSDDADEKTTLIDNSASDSDDSILSDESTAIPAPEMDIIIPHAKDTDDAESADDTDKAENADDAENTDADAIADEVLSAISAGETDTEEKAASADETASDEKDKAAIDSIIASADEITGTDTEKKKHSKAPLIIILVIVIVLCLLAAALVIFREQAAKLLGTDLLSFLPSGTVTETTVEETTEEITTEEPTTTAPETTTEPETQETTTVEEEFTGTTFNVTIYADGEALSMKSVPDGDRLLYIPSDAEVTIDEVQDGWGHTSYDDQEGWIWLSYTKVADNAPVEKPETMLDATEERTVADNGENAELRTGPDDANPTFGPVPAGTVLTVEAYAESYGSTWAYTSYNGHHGWILADNLQ